MLIINSEVKMNFNIKLNFTLYYDFSRNALEYTNSL